MTSTYQCELCGLEFSWISPGRMPRWCPQDRVEGRRRSRRQLPRTHETLHTALAETVTDQRLAIQQAIHTLTLAALARQLGWDDRHWLQQTLDHLTATRTVAEALA